MLRLRPLLAGLLLLSLPAAAQSLDPTFASPTSVYAPGVVQAMGPPQADGKRLMAGFFSRVNGASYSGNLLRLDAAGAVDATFAQNVGTASNVYCVKAFASGQYLLGSTGGPIVAGGLTRTEVMRLNTDGTGDASFDSGTGPAINAVANSGYGNDYTAQPDGKVLVGGYFDSYNGTAANGLVRLNSNGSVDTGFNVGTGLGASSANYFYASTVAVQPDGKVLVGGYFDTFNGQPTYSLVRLNANGSRDATFTPPFLTNSYTATALVQPDGKILVSGNLFTTAGILGLVRLNTNGSLDISFSSTLQNITGGAGSDPGVVLQADGKLVVNAYSSATGTYQVTRLNTTGSLDTSFASITYQGALYSLGVQANGAVLLGGLFNNLLGTETALRSFTAAGTLDATFAPKLQRPGTITKALRQPDGQILLGGSITEYNGVAVHQVVRVSAAGVLDASFAAATGVLPGPANALALQPDGKVLVGSLNGVVRLASSGTPDASFVPFAQTSTTVLALQPDGRIVVGGSFSGSSGGVSYSNLVRLTSTGAFDPTFARQNSASVGTMVAPDALLVQADGRIVVSGQFLLSGQPSVGRVVRYESTGTLDATFNNMLTFGTSSSTNNISGRVYSLVQQPDGKLLAGGSFNQVSGSLQYGVARLTTTGSVDTGFNPNGTLNGTVFSVALQPNGRVLLGGVFLATGAAGQLTNLARVGSDGQSDGTFTSTTTPNSTIRSLVVQPDGAILLTGSFSTLGGQPRLQVARITAPNVLAVAAPAAVAAHTSAWPVPAHSVLHVAPDLSAHPLSAELLDALGRPVRQQAVGGATEFEMSVDNLPAGMYLLRVNYAAGAVTRRLAVE